MKFIRQRIVVPESSSFMINKLDLSLNTDKIHSHMADNQYKLKSQYEIYETRITVAEIAGRHRL